MQDTTMLEKTLDRLLQWIRAADAKANFILALDTAMLGVLAALATKPLTCPAWYVCPGLAAFGLLVSMCMLAVAAFPRTTGPPGSLIYFGGIVSHERKTYVAKLRELSPEDYSEDLAQQCYRNAEIAEAKFKWIQRSMIALFSSVLPWLLALYCLRCAQ